MERFHWFMEARPELTASFHDPRKLGVGGRRLFSVLDETKLRRVLRIMLDEQEFLSPYGIRSLSRYHANHPYVFRAGGEEYRVGYLPAESDTSMFGGNSNWRGPIWMPVNVLILRALLNYYAYYGDSFLIDFPTGSGRRLTLYQVAEEIARRLTSIFLKDAKRPKTALRWGPEVPGRPVLAGASAILRVLPGRRRSRAGGQPSDWLDGDHRPDPASVLHHDRGTGEEARPEGGDRRDRIDFRPPAVRAALAPRGRPLGDGRSRFRASSSRPLRECPLVLSPVPGGLFGFSAPRDGPCVPGRQEGSGPP